LNTKVGYRGVVNVSTEEMWIHNLMGELGFLFGKPNVVYFDNQSVVQVANNPMYCTTNDQITNIFMKSLTISKYVKPWDILALHEVTIIGGNT